MSFPMHSESVLVLAPHTDDAELGCGGTIARLIAEGRAVHVAAFSTAEESIPSGFPPGSIKLEMMLSLQSLGVPATNIHVFDFPVRKLPQFRQELLEIMVRLARSIAPDLVLIPSRDDVHQDHQAVHAEAIRAFKCSSILGYELPWNQTAFAGQAFMELNQSHLDAKWQALKSYRTQMSLERSYFSASFIEGLARIRGVQGKFLLAEAFEVLRFRIVNR